MRLTACFCLSLLVGVAAGPAPAAPATAIQDTTYIRYPSLAIPDAGAAVTADVVVALGYTVDSVRVYLNISHAYTSDLTVRLQSPAATNQRVSWIGEGGEPEVNIVGWYPGDFTPKDPIGSAYDGETTDGAWTLYLQDHSVSVAGTLNEWRLQIFYDDAQPVVASSWGGIKALYR